MNMLVIGNIVAFIAASFSIIMGISKNREKMIYVQTFQFLIYAIANFILGGFSGAVASVIGAVRNILCYKEKLTKLAIILIVIISTVLTLLFNNLGFIGLLPLINTIIYTVFINVKNPLKFKILYLVVVLLWFIYDVTIKAYTSAVFDIISITSSFIIIFKMYKNSHSKEQQQN